MTVVCAADTEAGKAINKGVAEVTNATQKAVSTLANSACRPGPSSAASICTCGGKPPTCTASLHLCGGRCAQFPCRQVPNKPAQSEETLKPRWCLCMQVLCASIHVDSCVPLVLLVHVCRHPASRKCCQQHSARSGQNDAAGNSMGVVSMLACLMLLLALVL